MWHPKYGGYVSSYASCWSCGVNVLKRDGGDGKDGWYTGKTSLELQTLRIN